MDRRLLCDSLSFNARRWVGRVGPPLARLVAALAWLSWAAGASAVELRLAVSKGPVSLPIYVAQANGYFAQEGVAVRLRECSSGKQCFDWLAGNEADLATAAELVMTLNSAAGSDAAIIATISSSVRHIKLIARSDGGVQVPADLRGRRIGTVQRTSAQYFLDSWLLFHDIDPKSVSVVPMAPDQLVDALKNAQVDAVAIWEPIASAALEALGGRGRALPSARIYTQHFSLIARRAAIREREADLLALLRALSHAERFIAEQPAQARQILQAKLQGEPGLDHIAEHDFQLALSQSLIGTMDRQWRWATHEGLVAGGSGTGGLLRSVEPALLRRALPGAVSLVP